MPNLDLKKLNRAELLELLLAETKENRRLRELLEEAQAKLEERRLVIDEVGDLANAVVKINGLMEAAQQSAAQYLENIKIMEKETKDRCKAILEEAKKEAALIRDGELPKECFIQEETVLPEEIEETIQAEKIIEKATAFTELLTIDDVLTEDLVEETCDNFSEYSDGFVETEMKKVESSIPKEEELLSMIDTLFGNI